MRNIKLIIEYDGTHFNGWQLQPNGARTVQGEIEAALKKIFKKKVRLIASGRTDSGVHALGQVANFKISSSMPLKEIRNALNANIAPDVAIISTEEAAPDFHARYSAKSKTYRYTILNREARGARERHISLFCPYTLNLRRMREEAKTLIGRKDFRSFQASDPLRKEKNTVRAVKALTIRKQGDYIHVDMTADGFLYKMVRNIVGTLLEAGSGRLPKGSIRQILAQKNRAFAATTAKPHGLTLIRVQY
jgi:tRNA pseudouridine38-40 synthase